jgi:hypothetical protein
VRKDIQHIIPHILYYILSMGALAKVGARGLSRSLASCRLISLRVVQVVYNCMQPGVTQDDILGQGVSLIWIGVVLWQLWPPIGESPGKRL